VAPMKEKEMLFVFLSSSTEKNRKVPSPTQRKRLLTSPYPVFSLARFPPPKRGQEVEILCPRTQSGIKSAFFSFTASRVGCARWKIADCPTSWAPALPPPRPVRRGAPASSADWRRA